MKKLVLVPLLALALAAPASAKELESVTVCGASGCNTLRDSSRNLERLAQAAEPVSTPAAPAPYYVLTYRGKAETETFGWKSFYVPSSQMLFTIDEERVPRWMPTTPDSQAAIDAAIERLDVSAFGVPHVTGAVVGGKAVEGDASAYLDLFAVDPAGAPSPAQDWVPIDLLSDRGSPWTSSDRDLMFSASARTIERGGTLVRVDDDVAAGIAAAQPLHFDGGGFAWRTLVAVFAALALAIGGALLLQRLRIAPSRRPEPV